jgi:phytoene dehydrogenase-like protein
LNGGWQTLVDALAETARVAGGTISSSARVDAIEAEASGHRLRLADGDLRARSVIVAAAPEIAAEIVAAGRHERLRKSVASVRPIRAACLDLALTSTPRPKAKFALGIDRPLYFSLHSAAAELAPPGGALIHAAKYLGGDVADDAGDDARELEAHVDRLQPGWRDVVIERRLLPNMIVAHDLPSADRGGLAGRIGVAIDDLPGVYLAGDWVGAEAHLADASLASAAAAVDLAVGGGGTIDRRRGSPPPSDMERTPSESIELPADDHHGSSEWRSIEPAITCVVVVARAIPAGGFRRSRSTARWSGVNASSASRNA